MESITKCLNEWNATLEALGQGKQSILIRNYKTTVEEFLLYPTVSNLNHDDYLDSFQDKYQDFVKDNSHPLQEDQKYQVKYYATVEAVMEKTANRIRSLSKHHIWTNEHVRSYINSNKAHVWLLRVYKLKEPVFTGRSMGMVFANTDKPVALGGVPVLSGFEFKEIKKVLVVK